MELAWVSAAQRALDWAKPAWGEEVCRTYGAAPIALVGLVSYLRPQWDFDRVRRVLARADVAAWVVSGLNDAGHTVEVSHPPHGVGGVADPIARAWHLVRSDQIPGDAVAEAADAVLAQVHGASPAVTLPPTLPRVPVPLVAIDHVLDAKERAFALEIHDDVDGEDDERAFRGHHVAKMHSTPTERYRADLLITRQARSWLWLAGAAAQKSLVGGMICASQPDARGIRLVIRTENSPDHAHYGKMPRVTYLELRLAEEERGGPVCSPLLWPAALMSWPYRHVDAALSTHGPREGVAAGQPLVAWSALAPRLTIHSTHGVDRIEVTVHEALPDDA